MPTQEKIEPNTTKVSIPFFLTLKDIRIAQQNLADEINNIPYTYFVCAKV